jgi:deazaflavin-dependent oxidoreductase (nitroreductase family)
MAKAYRVTGAQRLANIWFAMLSKHGRGANYRHILTVAGRKSGLPRSTPVDVMTISGQRWLVAPYGEVNWVRNLRAAGKAILRRGRLAETLHAEPASAEQAIPVIRAYLREVPRHPPLQGGDPRLHRHPNCSLSHPPPSVPPQPVSRDQGGEIQHA